MRVQHLVPSHRSSGPSLVVMTETTSLPFTRHIGTFVSVEDGIAHLKGLKLAVIASDEDAAHPGHWDVAATRGFAIRLFTIEPVKGA